jgi:glycerophosphoryl diester phosphodiesterase
MMLIGHAGWDGTRPNSVKSIERAARVGLEYVEIDVHASADGVPVLCHDGVATVDGRPEVPVRTLPAERVFGHRGVVLRGQPGPAERVEVLLGAARELNVGINLDIKDRRAVPAVVRAVDHCEMRDRVIVTGCEPGGVKQVRGSAPRVRVLLNVDGALRQAPEELVALAVSLGCAGLNVDHRVLDEHLARVARLRLVAVAAWTVDRPADLVRVRRLGASAVTTRRVDALLPGR